MSTAERLEPSGEETALATRSAELIEQAERYVVDNNDSYEDAGEFLKVCKRFEAGVNGFMGPIVQSWHAGHKQAKAKENSLLHPVKQAREIVGLKMGAFDHKCEEERRQEEAMVRD